MLLTAIPNIFLLLQRSYLKIHCKLMTADIT
nr:unnamed protein product [Callosobruchus chinensis]